MATTYSYKAINVHAAKTFRESIDNTNRLYAFIGRSVVWTSDLTPPDLTGVLAEEATLRTNLLAVKKISLADTSHVIPRHTWQAGVVYNTHSTSTTMFYVVTDDYNVYKCLSNNGGIQSTVKPTGTITTNITTGDGYVWKFMYNLSPAMVSTFLTDQWIPVPQGGQRTAFHTAVEAASTYASGQSSEGNGSSAIHELLAHNIMVVQSFSGSETSAIDTDVSFRQVGLIADIKLTAGNAAATGAVYNLNTSDSNGDVVNRNSGRLMYAENKTPITRSNSQTEKIRFVVTF